MSQDATYKATANSTHRTSPLRRRHHARDVVAIFNTSPDAVNLLRDVLEHAAMLVVSAYTFGIRKGC
jgi:hypothetical protein